MSDMQTKRDRELAKSLDFDWFEDVTMTLPDRATWSGRSRRMRVDVVYQLRASQMPSMMLCQVVPWGPVWLRKTMAHGRGSVRYQTHPTLAGALQAGARWAARKRRESARERTNDNGSATAKAGEV